jgi:hypothetical protein
MMPRHDIPITKHHPGGRLIAIAWVVSPIGDLGGGKLYAEIASPIAAQILHTLQ